ncbi:MAG: glycosyltransferase family 4 protein [Eubacteriales bacterium]|nr:glycosyltransferase family 4 protein [Eubacteriales bacterium]
MLKKRPKKVSSDFAPWISYMANGMDGISNIDIHVISPHSGLTKLRHSFVLGNISYHFFKPDKDIFAVNLARRIFKGRTPQYGLNRKSIKQFIDDIQPDLVVIIGAENPYYSISAMDISSIPILLIAQTVYTNPERMKLSGHVNRDIWKLELQIHERLQYFSCNARLHRDLILEHNPNAVIFRHRYPQIRPKKIDSPTKKYDFVFYAATIAKKKGIEDALIALSIVKRFHDNVSLDVVGGCSPETKLAVDRILRDYKLENNVVFHDYFPKHSDMHAHIQQGRVALLPIKLDSIPGTVSEAMMLDLPVVSYITSGTPRLNKYGEAVLLCEINDVEALAKNMIRVMDEPDLVDRLISNSRKYVEIEIDNDRSANNFVRMFYAVYENYHRQVPIPKDLLFDPKEFPIYTREVSI